MTHETPVLSPLDVACTSTEQVEASVPSKAESPERIEGFTLQECATVLAHQEFFAAAGPAAVEQQLGVRAFQKAYLGWMLRLLKGAPGAESLAYAQELGSAYQAVTEELKLSQRRLEDVEPLGLAIPIAEATEAHAEVTAVAIPHLDPTPQTSIGLVLSLLDGAELAAQLFLAPTDSEAVYQRFGLADPYLRQWVLTEFNQRLQDPATYQQWRDLYYAAVTRPPRTTAGGG